MTSKIEEIFASAVRGDEQAVRSLLQEHPALANAEIGGERVLHQAAGNGKVGVVKLLVEHGAEIDPLDDRGVTPLWFAAYEAEWQVARFLVEHGANVHHKRPRDGADVLCVATICPGCDSEAIEFVELLLKSGVKLNIHSALQLGRTAVARQMIAEHPEWRNSLDIGNHLLNSVICSIKFHIFQADCWSTCW